MADRLIYADLLRKDIDKTIEHIAEKQGGTEEGSFAVGMCLAFKTMINEQPTIEAKPVVHAHWKDCENSKNVFCTNCGVVIEKEIAPIFKYCCACGAQMDEGVKIPVISMEDVPKIMEEMEK